MLKVLLGIGVILLGYGIFAYFRVRVRTLDLNRFDIPLEAKGKRIVFVSDMQFDHSWYFLRRHSQSLVERIAKLNPDLIIFGGDLIHSKNKYNQEALELWTSLKAPIVAVIGNHDNKNKELVTKIYKEKDVKLLINDEIIWESIRLIGVDDVRTGHPKHYDLDERFTIILSHDPDYFEEVEKWNGFGLSGHLHKGQINFFGYAPILPSAYGQKYQYGWVDDKIYVSSGLGAWVFFLPLRINADPEIIVLDL